MPVNMPYIIRPRVAIFFLCNRWRRLLLTFSGSSSCSASRTSSLLTSKPDVFRCDHTRRYPRYDPLPRISSLTTSLTSSEVASYVWSNAKIYLKESNKKYLKESNKKYLKEGKNIWRKANKKYSKESNKKYLKES